ncbi:hypothetical protein ACN38_g11904 [Penicillium nordicum]|uniref:Uncharacterized protein n=1 Tax=Penicillium nordicum TaxID=229535 RepID=A0A0M8NQH1_9EURO|nr:hypothetical protein ACN38_g11904 [Penicillium nordicum]
MRHVSDSPLEEKKSGTKERNHTEKKKRSKNKRTDNKKKSNHLHSTTSITSTPTAFYLKRMHKEREEKWKKNKLVKRL